MSDESELGGHEKPTQCGSFLPLPTAPLVSEITYRSNSTTRMTTTKSFDYLNRLQSMIEIGFGLTNRQGRELATLNCRRPSPLPQPISELVLPSSLIVVLNVKRRGVPHQRCERI